EGLKCPRMPPDVYERLKKKYMDHLSHLFSKVTCAHDAPNKPDHGDIDMIVAGPLSPSGVSSEQLAKHCDAASFQLNGPVTSLAVPYPKSENTLTAWEQEDAWVQLDVHTCDPDLVEWTSFMESYGDLMQIIGHTHRWTGLTLNNKGMSVRISEIEPEDKKASLLFLTRDPAAVMEFLGLNIAAYDKGFGSEDDIYGWVSSARFFDRRIFDNVTEEERTENANDRRRKKTRPMFARFVDDWIIHHHDCGKGVTATREDISREAIATFDKQDEYWAKVSAWRRKSVEADFWRTLKANIAKKDKKLRFALKACKHWIIVTEGK
ncbi:hypothetical protein K490DRAFT_10828, partial [Saccharata proteae CBS 121410]